MSDRKPPTTELPSGAGEGVNVEYLANALDDKTNSYKFLLLKVILERMESYAGEGHLPIDLDFIRQKKLVYSWFPSRQFRLNFGKQDKVARAHSDVLNNELVAGESYTSIEQVSRAFEDRAREIVRIPSVKKLVRYSICRLIKPAFEEELQEIDATDDYARTKKIPKWSNQRFDSGDPPIYSTDNKTKIVIHERWCKYLSRNLRIIHGWLDSKWMQDLSRKNPNVPGLAHKLWELPNEPESLGDQREGWKAYLKAHDLSCIYTRPTYSIDRHAPFELDHFLPRSWVGHDQMWNLIPANPIINKRKRNFLPAKSEIEKLAATHFQFLSFAFENKIRHLEDILEEYRFGLHVKDADLKDKEKLREAYLGNVEPLLLLARRQGFRYWPEKERVLKNGN